MAWAFSPKVITANDLRAGDVVYLTHTDQWSRDLAQADILYDDPSAQARLQLASQHSSLIVGAYLVDVDPGPTGPKPRHLREEFRRKGPSNYFHGKQESAENV